MKQWTSRVNDFRNYVNIWELIQRIASLLKTTPSSDTLIVTAARSLAVLSINQQNNILLLYLGRRTHQEEFERLADGQSGAFASDNFPTWSLKIIWISISPKFSQDVAKIRENSWRSAKKFRSRNEIFMNGEETENYFFSPQKILWHRRCWTKTPEHSTHRGSS